MAKGPGSLLGQTLGQFQIKEELGRGGMAVVYKGYQQSLDRWVAIKTLPIELAADREMVSRFHREAEAMVSLNHTNIVQIIDKGEDKGCYYFAMEFVAGPSLKDMLKETELSIDLLFEVAIQVTEGLGYAHKKGIIHRDIKPANILWETGTSLAKVADFGIARVNNKELEMITLTANNVGMGTMNYMSPEQKTDAKAVDHRADIYSLGVMIYEMFTGKLPLGKFKMPAEMNPKLPRKLDEVLSKCLETDPADRWQSMDELRAGLVEARAQAKGGTLVRSVRDAAERTLTAMAGGGGGGKVVAGLLGCTVMLGGLAGAGFAVKKYVIDPRAVALNGTDTGTGSPGTDTGTKPPTDTGTKPGNTEKGPGTGTKPPTDTGTKPGNTEKGPGTGTKPPTDTGTKPPNTGTGSKPPTDTSTKPPADTATRPPTDTATKPPTDTGTRPPTDTGTKPPADTGTKPPTETETGPTPAAAELSAADTKKFDEAREKLDALLTKVTDEAQRAGIRAAVTPALDAGREALEAAERLRGEGKPAAIERAREAGRALQEAATLAFADATRKRIAEASAAAGPDQRQTIDDAQKAYDAAADMRPEDQIAAYSDALVKARRAIIEGRRAAARLTLAMASTRAPDGPALAEVRKALEDAAALERSKPDEAVALYRTGFEKGLAVRGPAVKGLKALSRLPAKPELAGFYSLCAGPGGRVAAIGQKNGQNMLFVYEVKGGQLVAASTARAIEEQGKFVKPRYVAPAGEGAFWVANLNRIRRIQADGRSDLELTATDAPIFDIDTGPDGSLWVAGTKTVTVFDARTYQPRNVASIPDRTFTPYFDVPRRLACLPRGWVLAGESGHADSPTSGEGKKAAQDAVWEDESNERWEVSLRYGLDQGPVGSYRSANGLEPLAIAPVGNGVLVANHAKEKGGFYLFPEDLSAPPAAGLKIAGDVPLLTASPKAPIDLAVSGGYVVVLHWRDPTGDPDLRIFVTLYELVP